MATKFEQAFAKMTPQQRKAVSKSISDMMGMPPKKKKTTTAGVKKKR